MDDKNLNNEISKEINNEEEKKTNKKIKNNFFENFKNKQKELENKKIFTVSETIIMVILFSLISILVSSTIADFKKESVININNQVSKLKEVEEMYDTIMNMYYEDVSKETLINGAINGMLEAIGDPYTTILDDKQSETIDILLNGSYQGVGVLITNDIENNIYITGIVEDSPASLCGLEVYDQILEVNNVVFKGKTTKELTDYIKNIKEKEFVIKVLRGEEEKEFTVSRKFIELKSVSKELIEQDGKKIGYIYVSVFANNTDIQFKKALDELEQAGIDSLIVDVRDNSGGHLTSVSNMISDFVSSEYIMYNIESNGVVTPHYSTGMETKKYPIVVLINNNSASASEVLAGALRDNLKATLIGETSFGKGTVQRLMTLKDGSYYKITTDKWLTPNKTWVNEKGLVPDIGIELSKEYDGTRDKDNQLNAAIDYLKDK